jgi:hypothetical protein
MSVLVRRNGRNEQSEASLGAAGTPGTAGTADSCSAPGPGTPGAGSLGSPAAGSDRSQHTDAGTSANENGHLYEPIGRERLLQQIYAVFGNRHGFTAKLLRAFQLHASRKLQPGKTPQPWGAAKDEHRRNMATGMRIAPPEESATAKPLLFAPEGSGYAGFNYKDLQADLLIKIKVDHPTWQTSDAQITQHLQLVQPGTGALPICAPIVPDDVVYCCAASTAADDSSTRQSEGHYDTNATHYIIGEITVSEKQDTVRDKILQLERLVNLMKHKRGGNIDRATGASQHDIFAGAILAAPGILKQREEIYATIAHYAAALPNLSRLMQSGRLLVCDVPAVIPPWRGEVDTLRQDVAVLRTDVADLRTEMASVRTGLSRVQRQLEGMEDRTTRIVALLEGRTLPAAAAAVSLERHSTPTAEVEAPEPMATSFCCNWWTW